MQMFNPPHPGEIIKDALGDLPMSVTAFAAHLGVSRVNLSRMLNGHIGISAEMSIKLSEAFGQKQADLWFRLQADYDFWHAARRKRNRVKPLPGLALEKRAA